MYALFLGANNIPEEEIERIYSVLESVLLHREEPEQTQN
jgi:hypothetical protein